MSWDGYVQSMMQGKYLNNAAILGANGVVYAHSEGFEVGEHTVKVQNESGDIVETQIDERQILVELFKTEGLVANPPGISLTESAII